MKNYNVQISEDDFKNVMFAFDKAVKAVGIGSLNLLITAANIEKQIDEQNKKTEENGN